MHGLSMQRLVVHVWWLCVGLWLLTSRIRCANVLLLYPNAASHPLYVNAIGEGIMQYNHTVYTVLHSSVPYSKAGVVPGMNVLNYKSRHTVHPFYDEVSTKEVATMTHAANTDTNQMDRLVGEVFNADCEDMLEDEQFLATIRQLNISVAIADSFLLNKCNLLVPHVLQIPLITVACVAEPAWHYRIPSLPSVTPIPKLMAGGTPVMNFFQRLENFLTQVVQHWFHLPNNIDNSLLYKYRITDDVNHYDDIVRSSELLFVMRDYLIEYPRAYYPHVVELSGITTREAKDLNSEWRQFVDSSDKGFILVTFGSAVESLPEDFLKALYEAFLSVEYQVIWRVGKKQKFDGCPSRIKLAHWIPQNDLLAHKNLKLFITHGGNNGQYEAIYHGAPMLTIPLFGDQMYNGARIKYHSYGDYVPVAELTSERLLSAIDELINNPVYKTSVQRASSIMRGRPMDGRQLAGYWTDYIIKYGGKDLRSVAMDLPLYQYLLLDVLLLLVVVVVLLLFFLVVMTRWAIRKVTCKAGKSDDKID